MRKTTVWHVCGTQAPIPEIEPYSNTEKAR